MKVEKPSYFSILTADVRYDKRLSASEKVLYSEITALANKEGYCYATNGYFAKLYEVAESTISVQIRKLAECGYLTISIENGYKRKIYIKYMGDLEKSNTPLLENLKGDLEKSNTPPLEKSKDNNTSNNNLINNYEKKESEPGQTDFAEVSKEYDKRYPMTLSSFKSQQLADILANYGKEATLFAIRESLSANAVKPIEYIRSVAMNYSRKKENGQKTEPKRESLEEIGKRIKEETEKARAEGKSMTPDEMKQKVIDEMKRKGMKIVGNSTPA
jgi:hypothetical protein